MVTGCRLSVKENPGNDQQLLGVLQVGENCYIKLLTESEANR